MAGYVTLDAAAIAELLTGPSGPVVTWLTTKAIQVESAAKALCPVDNGHLRASITHELRFDSGPYAAIGSNLSYARFVEEGTGIYGPTGAPIVPKTAKFLVFTPKGSAGPVFARSVSGRPATPYLQPALESVMASA